MFSLRQSPSGPTRYVGLPQVAAGPVPDADGDLAGVRHTCQVYPANPTYYATGDAGSPAGAFLPGLHVLSGSSGTVTKSGKRLEAIRVNGISVF